ncbi:protein shisa-5-like [Sphaeramia orbicularis]|uniref:Protein shisa-5 n=1 Tax=Sphaeramia orbicularis TaxID=375764 RepID=A0A672Y380_9TELE|nr:protein shisa-5-like [Sphaeramia orbicularis]
MASALCTVVVCAVFVFLAPGVSAGGKCEAYTDLTNTYHPSQRCYLGFCCGSCFNRYCCQDSFFRLSEDKQEECDERYTYSSTVPLVFGITGFIVFILIVICCCVCPCCCLYKMCRKPQPVIATTTHTTVVTSTPQHYPQQPTAVPQSYQGAQYPAYQPVPVQPGYGAQPMPTMPYQGQPYKPGPPPTYQEATGPAYPVSPMHYSQAAFTPGQPSYPLQPPVQPQPVAPPPQPDYLAQPAYNPDYVAPPP